MPRCQVADPNLAATVAGDLIALSAAERGDGIDGGMERPNPNGWRSSARRSLPRQQSCMKAD